jgi:UDP:flavonoid glycosyltransferase YjiC (YdhE family)
VRILFGFVGGRGHFQPLVPLAGAAVAAGHTVLFTCSPSIVPVVRRAGFEATGSGADYGSTGERLPLAAPRQEREDNDVRIERFIPQAELLPKVSLVVSHGGSGSLNGSFAHGLPSVLVPMGADQLLNAARAEAVGAAKVLHAVDARADEFRDAAAEVLAEPSYQQAAERLRAEIAAQPPAPYAVGLIEALG